jgi:hypothetical protein
MLASVQRRGTLVGREQQRRTVDRRRVNGDAGFESSGNIHDGSLSGGPADAMSAMLTTGGGWTVNWWSIGGRGASRLSAVREANSLPKTRPVQSRR